MHYYSKEPFRFAVKLYFSFVEHEPINAEHVRIINISTISRVRCAEIATTCLSV